MGTQAWLLASRVCLCPAPPRPPQWKSGQLVQLGWTASEDLLCIQEDGTVLIYNLFCEFKRHFSMGNVSGAGGDEGCPGLGLWEHRGEPGAVPAQGMSCICPLVTVKAQASSAGLAPLGWFCAQHHGAEPRVSAPAQEVLQNHVLEAKVFHSEFGTGVAILTGSHRFSLATNIEDLKLRRMPEVPGASRPRSPAPAVPRGHGPDAGACRSAEGSILLGGAVPGQGHHRAAGGGAGPLPPGQHLLLRGGERPWGIGPSLAWVEQGGKGAPLSRAQHPTAQSVPPA